MNRTQLIGRLGRDPVGGQSGKGTYANFSLATNEYWTDKASGELIEHTEWHHLVCYDRLAEIAMEFLTKGSEVYVEGRQRTTWWTDKDGMDQSRSEVRIDEMKMLRKAPRMDPVLIATKSMASIERLMKDVALGLISDVSMDDLAEMLNVVRTGLAGDDDEPKGKLDERTTRHRVAA
ncbi:single-stranded DNA-binding protein [Variovorax sp. J22R133]|uniref:single-stranded DNA-binding protein n=1 Tax=Variovorax brevis TaxID=3053503 RepID=UPI002577F89B|nr:single-stranded DNA-binding protein [Variovorax sp. J22R133]MDM0116763.1 single-stranded DNA-binding protein [Variovorax sp. J22R133]